ncbi:MAG TPA: hypothetical protein VMT11_17670 [Myxococcaceae bacterium]|nr:hypothetical protein [Myxococcaceae bacterium]
MRLAALLLLVGATDAAASSALAMDVSALTAASSEVVRARVASSRAEWSGDHRRIVTRVDLEVLESWKGLAVGRLTVLQPGGARDGLVQQVAGVAPLAPGEEVVLFLARSGPYHRVVGLAQGVYRISRRPDAEAFPASLEGLDLVAPPGGVIAPRTTISLARLRAQVEEGR